MNLSNRKRDALNHACPRWFFEEWGLEWMLMVAGGIRFAGQERNASRLRFAPWHDRPRRAKRAAEH